MNTQTPVAQTNVQELDLDIDGADDDELWEDVELTAPVTASQASVPGNTPQVSTAPEVTEEDDDLPF